MGTATTPLSDADIRERTANRGRRQRRQNPRTLDVSIRDESQG
jgi:hypothetical protein